MTNSPNCKECSRKSDSVFSTVTLEENTFIESEKTCENYKRGDVIYREGSRINGVFCICSGVLKIYKTGSDGKEQIVAFAKEGNIMGYRSVLSHEPACTTAQAIEDALICYIPAAVIINIVKTNGEFALSLMQLICKELNQANSYIKDIAQKTVRERLAEVLLMLETNFGINEEGYLNITLTREELANIVGTATESVIRLLSEFKSEEIIVISRKYIKLNNRAFLKKLSKSFS
ncbi:MAG TPA: Crp/Fnr family transcriptional regulator [Bacteroidales bacterium]|jgi:CRP-like cAMP-binding protein|nr:Crp/Fnr family transcriptional regulator [Bacteroidales bacterium]